MSALNSLLAEDNLQDVYLVREALKEHHINHELHVVKDAGEALQFVSRLKELDGTRCPDVMLLDINMPQATGSQVLEAFRKRCTSTPVIIVTSSDARSDRLQMEQLGAAYYFKKPSNLAGLMQLGAVVRSVVEKTNV